MLPFDGNFSNIMYLNFQLKRKFIVSPPLLPGTHIYIYTYSVQKTTENMYTFTMNRG